MAKITKFDIKKGGNVGSNRKEKHYVESWILLTFNQDSITQFFDGFDEVVDIRVYQTANTTSACVWTGMSGNARGSGIASGYNYNLKDAAIKEALIEVGIEFDTDVSPKTALQLIAKKMGYKYFTIINTHG